MMLGKPPSCVIVIHVQFIPDFGTPKSMAANVLAYLFSAINPNPVKPMQK